MDYTKKEWEIRKEQPNNPDSWEYDVISPLGTNKSHYHIASNMNKTNAQLIASAPDLYEALKAIQSNVICNGNMSISYAIDGNIIKKIRQALAKAEGK